MYSSLINEPCRLPDAFCNPQELLPFAKVKLVAFDLDGTLISSPKDVVGNRLIRLFSLLGAPGKNVRLTLATGRTLTGVSTAVKQLGGFKSVPVVLYNGSVVIEPESERLVAHTMISPPSIVQILELMKQLPDGSLFVYTVDPAAKLISGYSSVESVFYVGSPTRRPQFDFNGMPVRPFSEMSMANDNVVAALVSVEDAYRKAVIAEALRNIEGISITASGSMYIEIRPAGSSKAFGLEILCRRYGISQDHVLAVGDNDNDVELLCWAGLSVCVKNSSPAARSASKYYSTHGAGSAAIEILEIIRRAQRLFARIKKA